MKWTDATSTDDESLRIPANWLFLHYYEALTILFRVENALRMFVYVVLKDQHKGKWNELSIGTEEGPQTSIAAVAKKRMTQDATFGYLGYAIASPLMHLTSGELIRIILSDSYWPAFKPYFPASKEIVQTKLEEIGNVRNALAHFRPLKRDDVQVVRQNANQVLSRVEDMLARLVGCNTVVPTNTPDAWYIELKAVSAPNVQIEFRQSEDGTWIQIGIRYGCPELAKPTLQKTYRSYRRLTVLTPPVLKASPAILDNIIFASEDLPFLYGKGDPDFYKTVQLLFSRATLTSVHADVKADLTNVLGKITSETDLIREDNLARGDFVRAAWVSARRDNEDADWQYSTSNLASPAAEGDPTEYWAGKPFFGQHFLTNTESYPWMPVNISEFSTPF
jgi:hypothetical protein